REAQALAALNHPGIVVVHDVGVIHGRPFLAMELVDGRPITDYCNEQRLPLNDRVHLLRETAEAVASAHRQLVVHGDIKASNVLVTEGGQVRLLDFGIGRLLGGGAQHSNQWRALTPSVASPEQNAGQPPTPSSDIYQLGLLMRVVLAGTAPSTGRRSEELSEIERRASAEDPKSRYPGADRMGDDLLAFANQRPVAAVGGGAFYRLRCFGRRRWGGLLAGGLILALALSAAAYQVHQNEQLEQRNAANEAMLAYLEELLERDDPKSAGSSERPLGSLLDDAALELTYRLSKHPEARARVLNALGRIHQARTELTVAEQRFSAAIFVAREHDLSDALEEALEGLAVVGSWSGSYERS
ncbi:MAG: serine/threonine-protein kinase, partial [Myxococcota bacterium]